MVDVNGIGVGKTPGAGIDFNRLELALNWWSYFWLVSFNIYQCSCDRLGPIGYVTEDIASHDGARRRTE